MPMNAVVWIVSWALIAAADAGATGQNPAPAAAPAAAVLPMCPVMGEPIDFTVSARTDEGPVFFCCQECVQKYGADPSKYASKVASQRQALDKRPKIQVLCPVTGDAVDSKAFIEQGGQKIHFCCPECIDKYKADPAKYKANLANSYTYQTQCPVMDEPITAKNSLVLPGGQKIYLCCGRCAKKLLADPAKYAPKLASQGVRINVDEINKQKQGG
jgi:YHS domain-containing protein